jgi:hypothetical protein
MCFSSHSTDATPSERYASKACSGCSSRSPRCEVETGLIVGGRYDSQRGSIANRLITSSAAAA